MLISLFLSTLSLRRATAFGPSRMAPCAYFYPRSPCGERPLTDDVSTGGKIFLSTLSLRRATCQWRRSVKLFRQFLSTLSLRRATYDTYAKVLRVNISIHALLAESDSGHDFRGRIRQRFLSTLSLRRATPPGLLHFLGGVISIHALLAESDHNASYNCHNARPISIHALLAESDSQQPAGTTRTTYFYPRSPCGERQYHIFEDTSGATFLSTLSLRRATLKPPIQTHRQEHFYPRSPCGERRAPRFTPAPSRNFYPRSPCGERPGQGP